MTVLLLLTVMRGAWAQTSPTEYCRQIGTDDTERSVPPSLVSAVVRLFQLETMPSAQVERSTYFRCAEGHVFVCTVGANLVCGKADTRRDLPGVKAWCAEHEGSQNVPAYVTGHATIYLWRCAGPRPAASRSALSVDQRGFISQTGRWWIPNDGRRRTASTRYLDAFCTSPREPNDSLGSSRASVSGHCQTARDGEAPTSDIVAFYDLATHDGSKGRG